MEETVSFKRGDKVRVINTSNKLVGKTGCVENFRSGKQIIRNGTLKTKNLVVVKLDGTGDLEQFLFGELEKI